MDYDIVNSRANPVNRSWYRADVDGLRAIAVIGVLLAHIDAVNLLPGGFLGVDVFFVISGFVITQLIIRERLEGSFSLSSFYIRRVRRLLPLLLVVIFVSLLISLFVTVPSRINTLAESALSALFGVSNFYFMFQDSYWAPAAAEQPLLHTWSLGVEEQFYVVFPFLLLLGLRFLRFREVLAVLTILVIGSFFAANYISNWRDEIGFYSLPTRAWELGTGALVALLLAKFGRLFSRRLALIIAGWGVSMIIGSYFVASSISIHPGVITLLPVVGTAMVIIAGATKNALSTLLSIRPIVAIGLLSYGIYLWHYPLLAFGRIVFGQLSIVAELGLLLISVGIAALSFFLIEKPFRNRRYSTARVVPMILGLFILVLAFLASIASTGGYLLRWSIPKPVSVDLEKYPEPLTIYGPDNGGPPVVILGDSHAEMQVSSLGDQVLESGYQFAYSVRPNCPFVIGMERANINDGQTHPRCTESDNAERLQFLEQIDQGIVVFHARLAPYLTGESFDNLQGGTGSGWDTYFRYPNTESVSLEESHRAFAEGYAATIDTVLAMGHHVVLVYPVPEVGWNVPDEIYLRSIRQVSPWPLEKPVTVSSDAYFTRNQQAFELLDRNNDGQIRRVYPHELFCGTPTAAQCVTHDEDQILYVDENHLSAPAAELLSAEIFEKVWELSALQELRN